MDQISRIRTYFIYSNCICDGRNGKSINCNFCSEEKHGMIYSEKVALRVEEKLKESLKQIF